MTFGEKIKLERTKRGMDQKEFAKLIQVSTRMISVYENGKSFPRTRADYARIAETLGVSVDYLLTENEEFIMNIGSEFGPRGAKGAQKKPIKIKATPQMKAVSIAVCTISDSSLSCPAPK